MFSEIPIGYYENLGLHCLSFRYSRVIWMWYSDYSIVSRVPIQFSHIPALGAAVWSLILTAIYFMLQSIVFRLSGRHDWLQLTVLVPAYLFSCTISLIMPSSPVSLESGGR